MKRRHTTRERRRVWNCLGDRARGEGGDRLVWPSMSWRDVPQMKDSTAAGCSSPLRFRPPFAWSRDEARATCKRSVDVASKEHICRRRLARWASRHRPRSQLSGRFLGLCQHLVRVPCRSSPLFLLSFSSLSFLLLVLISRSHGRAATPVKLGGRVCQLRLGRCRQKPTLGAGQGGEVDVASVGP